MADLIDRRVAIDTLQCQIKQCDKALSNFDISMKDEYAVKVERAALMAYKEQLEYLPAAVPERDTPIKPKETTDRAWGIPPKQAVCPKCDYYLGHVAYLGDYKGKRVTYCETCGQAIDWEGWEYETD